ncbi:MAG: hypothetical protein ACFFER_18150, partial [Candidatus Thorarchaeota archaeon]
FITINANSDELTLAGESNKLHYTLTSISDESLLDLSEPKKPEYFVSTQLPCLEFVDAAKGAAVVAKEIMIEIHAKKVILSATRDSYSYKANIAAKSQYSGRKRKINGTVILKYLQAIEPLIKLSTELHLNAGDEVPIQLFLTINRDAIFSFSLAPRKGRVSASARRNRQGKSLPRLTASKFPKYILYLSAFPTGVPVDELRRADIETDGRDYTRMAKMIGFVEPVGADLTLTETGGQFAEFLRSEIDLAKSYLHNILTEKVPSYGILISILREGHIEAEELYRRMNKEVPKSNIGSIDQQDFSTLIGLAGWCDKVDRRLGMIFSAT